MIHKRKRNATEKIKNSKPRFERRYLQNMYLKKASDRSKSLGTSAWDLPGWSQLCTSIPWSVHLSGSEELGSWERCDCWFMGKEVAVGTWQPPRAQPVTTWRVQVASFTRCHVIPRHGPPTEDTLFSARSRPVHRYRAAHLGPPEIVGFKINAQPKS